MIFPRSEEGGEMMIDNRLKKQLTKSFMAGISSGRRVAKNLSRTSKYVPEVCEEIFNEVFSSAVKQIGLKLFFANAR